MPLFWLLQIHPSVATTCYMGPLNERPGPSSSVVMTMAQWDVGVWGAPPRETGQACHPGGRGGVYLPLISRNSQGDTKPSERPLGGPCLPVPRQGKRAEGALKARGATPAQGLAALPSVGTRVRGGARGGLGPLGGGGRRLESDGDDGDDAHEPVLYLFRMPMCSALFMCSPLFSMVRFR